MVTRYVRKDVTWIDCVSPSSGEVRALIQEFGIDPIIAEEFLLPSYKSKVERHGDHLYVILHFPVLHGAQHHPEQEIDFLIGKDFLITTRYETVDPLHAFAKAFEVDAVLGRGTTTHGGHLFVSMAQNLYQAVLNECDTIQKRLTAIEEHIFRGDERRMVAKLSQVGRTIHDFRRSLAAHREMLFSFDPAGTRMFGQEFSYYVRNLVNAYERVDRTLTNLYDSLSELRETNNSLLSAKQNEIMKEFTVLAFVFLPLTFISGLFGMNTKNNPIVGHTLDFWIILSGMLCISLGFFFYFKRKGWL